MSLTNNRNREGGFTLLELLLVIGVAALLLIGAIFTYRLVSDGNKATDATRMLLTLRQEGQVLAQQQGGNYTGVVFDTATANAASPMVTSGILRDKQRNPFNGNIVIAPINAGDLNLSVEFTNVSQSACIRLLAAINDPNEIVSAGTATATYTSAAGTIPITAANASLACDLAANDITWIFP